MWPRLDEGRRHATPASIDRHLRRRRRRRRRRPIRSGTQIKKVKPPPTQMGKRHLHVGVMNNCRAERLVNKEKRKEERKEKPHKPEIGGRNRWRDEKRTDNGNENERVI